MPVSLVKAFQNLLMNNLSLSLTMFNDRPFSQYHKSKNCTEKCLAEIFKHVGVIQISELSLSMMVTMTLKPSLSEHGSMKSIAMGSPHPSGMGSG